MSAFSRFFNISLALRSILDLFVIRNISHILQFLLRFIRLASSPVSPASLGFETHISQIENLLATQDETSDAVTSALQELRSRYPLPPVQIIPKTVWPRESDCVVSVRTHLKSTIADAVNNLTSTGRNLSLVDEKYLRLLLTHPCGWSATYPEHFQDSWVEFFHVRYPQLEGLVPILDSMTYREELKDFPEDHYFRRPRFILLATSDRYFIWDASDWGQDGLFYAGDTLEEVFTGLRDWRWAESSENSWEMLEDGGEYLEPDFYFITYEHRKKGSFGILDSMEEIPG